MWNTEAQTDIAASPGRVWQLLADVAGWPRWNAGVAAARLLGPFATGSRFEMQLPDGGPLLQSELADVQPGRYFTDVTAFHGVVVRVTHAIAPQSEGGVRVTYRTEVEGPGAAEIGAGVSADFPDVLAALKRLAEAGAQRGKVAGSSHSPCRPCRASP
ncbi:MAG: SRPBCC family protein [Burkholderiaceae bacterium]